MKTKSNSKVSRRKNDTSSYTKKDSIMKKESVEEVKTVNNHSEHTYKVNKKRKKIYFGFISRMVINIISIIILIIVLIFTVLNTFSLTNTEKMKYHEESHVDYKVFLAENDFYDIPFLDKGMVYVASLIDHININFTYIFNSNVDSYINVQYKTKARLVIKSQTNSNVFYEKEYDLTSVKNYDVEKQQGYSINDSVDIDYPFYNELAKKFRSNYAVNTTSYLEVYLNVFEKGKEENLYDINTNNKTMLIIPLSEQEINIQLDNQSVNIDKEFPARPKLEIKDTSYIFLGIVCIVLLSIAIYNLCYQVCSLIKKTSKYDSYIKKILNSYDRIIITIKTPPELEKYNIIKVSSFEELVDVRDNVKEPIKYLVITEHQKSEFFITNNNDLYLYIVKAVDLDGEIDNENKRSK